MSGGFDVKVELPQDDIDKLIKDYKKIKKVQKSNMHEIVKLSGKKTSVDKLIEKYGDDLV